MKNNSQASPNLKRQAGQVSFAERVEALRQNPYIFWFTGLSGSGKTSIAIEFEKQLFEQGALVYHLDADDLRKSVNADLGFSDEDRETNIRRAASVARILQDAGVIVVATFITPTAVSRKTARDLARSELFCEIFVKADLETCIRRDPKGFYAKALRGEIEDYTGVQSLYEEPQEPDLVLDTDHLDIDACVSRLMDFVEKQEILRG